jgi:voltage-gated sodium channel
MNARAASRTAGARNQQQLSHKSRGSPRDYKADDRNRDGRTRIYNDDQKEAARLWGDHHDKPDSVHVSSDLLDEDITKDDLDCSCCKPWQHPIPKEAQDDEQARRSFMEKRERWKCSKRRPYFVATHRVRVKKYEVLIEGVPITSSLDTDRAAGARGESAIAGGMQTLEKGRQVKVLEEARDSSGRDRARTPHGWVSLRSPEADGEGEAWLRAVERVDSYPRLRAFNTCCLRFKGSNLFEYTVLVAILGVTVLIGVQSYDVESKAMDVGETLILVIFLVEIVVKMCARGPVYYFLVYWNMFDFTIVVLTLMPFGSDSMAVLRLLRLLRMMKLAKNPNLQAILTGLQKGMHALVHIMILLFIVYYVYAIVGIVFFRQNDPMHFSSLHEALLSLFRISTLEDWTDIMYLNFYGCGQTGYEYPSNRLPQEKRIDSLHDRGGAYAPADARSRLDVATATSGYGYHKDFPCTNPVAHPWLSVVFFVSFVVISALVMLSLFIGLISSEIEQEHTRLRDEQRRKNMNSPIVLADSKLRGCSGCRRRWFDEVALDEDREAARKSVQNRRGYRRCIDTVRGLCDSALFEWFITFAIFAAAVCAGLETEHASNGLNPDADIVEAVGKAEIVIFAIFTMEMLLLIFAEGARPWNYFREKMNCFDFFVVVVCLVSIIADSLGMELTALRILRLLRLLKLLDVFPELKNVVMGLSRGLNSIFIITAILVLVFYVYAIVGIVMFSKNDPHHFKTLHSAMVTLFRASTFEDWTDIMYIGYLGCDKWGYSDGADNVTGLGGLLADPGDPQKNTLACLHPQGGFGAIVYWISFIVVAAFIMLSLFVGVITNSMMDARTDQHIKKVKDQLLAQLENKFPDWLTVPFVPNYVSGAAASLAGTDEEQSIRKLKDSGETVLDHYTKLFNDIDLDKGGFLVLEEINDYLKQMYASAIKRHKERRANKLDPGRVPKIWSKQRREKLLQSLVVPRDDSTIKEQLNLAQFVRLHMASALNITPAELQHDIAITRGHFHLRLEWAPHRPPQCKLEVTVIQAKDLRAMDKCLCFSGKNDVYAKVDMPRSSGGSVSERTSTVMDCNSPQWNETEPGVRSTLTFEADSKPEHVTLRLFDYDENSPDDIIGSAKVSLEGRPSAQMWDFEEWLTLLDEKGQPSGRCRMKLVFKPAPDDAVHNSAELEASGKPQGRFRCTLIEAANLESMDAFGFNDVYAVVSLGAPGTRCPSLQQATERAELTDSEAEEEEDNSVLVQKSETIEDGGACPKWFGGGQTLQWNLDSVPPWIEVRVMDEDLDADDHIGTVLFDLRASGSIIPISRPLPEAEYPPREPSENGTLERNSVTIDDLSRDWEWEGWVDLKRETREDQIRSSCFDSRLSEEEQRALLNDQKVLSRLMTIDREQGKDHLADQILDAVHLDAVPVSPTAADGLIPVTSLAE